MKKDKLYTRYCKKCKNYYETERRYSKICFKCDERIRKNKK